jgi:hypothetical protein
MVGVMQMQTDPTGALLELGAAIDGIDALHDQAKQVMAIRRNRAREARTRGH